MVSVESLTLTIKRYADVITEMADTVGVSNKQVSMTTIESGAEVLKTLVEKTFPDIELIAVWIGGIQRGLYHVECAVEGDPEGNNYDLGILKGVTDNAGFVDSLLQENVGADSIRRPDFSLAYR